MEPILNSLSSYVVLSRKHFSRYVLTYEVLPLSFCKAVENDSVISSDTLKKLLSSGSLDEKDIVLELTPQDDRGAGYISLSELVKVWFLSGEERNAFLERSYANYDVSSLNCDVLPAVESSSEYPAMVILPPATVDRQKLFDVMADIDGALALLQQRFRESGYVQLLLPQLETALNTDWDSLLKFALNLNEMEEDQIKLALAFFELCVRNGINNGWIPADIVEALDTMASPDVTGTTGFERWIDTVTRLLKNERVNPFFTDDQNIILRAMMLVLMNPETEQLEAIKAVQGEGIGPQVYQLARSFVLARAGYSYLDDSQRVQVGDIRKTLQRINAFLHNRVANQDLKITLIEQSFAQVSEVIQDSKVIQVSEVVVNADIWPYAWLNEVSADG